MFFPPKRLFIAIIDFIDGRFDFTDLVYCRFAVVVWRTALTVRIHNLRVIVNESQQIFCRNMCFYKEWGYPKKI